MGGEGQREGGGMGELNRFSPDLNHSNCQSGQTPFSTGYLLALKL